MKLGVGVLGECEGWKNLLEQEGVPYTELTQCPPLDEVSVLIATDSVQSTELDNVKAYVEAGGALFCTSTVFAALFGLPRLYRYVKYISFVSSNQLSNAGILWLDTYCTFLPQMTDGRTDTGHNAVLFTPYGRGFIAVVSFDIDKLIVDTRYAVRSFYSPHRRLPFERVSCVSKSVLRYIFHRILVYLYHQRNLPYVHRWYFPDAARSVFCFRIDTDFGSAEQIDHLLEILEKNSIPATWFLDVQNQLPHLARFKEFSRHEIGVHCYQHQRYTSGEHFTKDVTRATTILRQHGFEVTGFAAPYGEWQPYFQSTLRSLGFEYSSEFSYDYDNLPSMTAGGMLQIPIHPICIGSLKRHSYSEKAMKGYFDEVLRKKLALNEPLIFYHHPRDMRYPVLDHLFATVKDLGIPSMTFRDFAHWWKQRMKEHFTCELHDQTLTFSDSVMDADSTVHILFPEGSETFLHKPLKLTLSDAKREATLPPQYTVPADYERCRKFNYRIPLIRWTDALVDFFRKDRVE